MNVYEVKLRARMCLARRSGKAFALLFGRAMLSVLLGICAYVLRMHASEVRRSVWVMLGEAVLVLLSVWLLSGLRQGTAAWFLRTARGQRASSVQVLYWVRHARSIKSRACQTAIRLRKTVWILLLNIPCFALISVWLFCRNRGQVTGFSSSVTLIGATMCGIIGSFFAMLVSQQYSLGLFLLSDDPSLSVRQAIRTSRVRMQPHCRKLLRLKLSFIPWFLSCVFILPIIYVAPYYCQSVACRMAEILSAASFGYEQSAGSPVRKRLRRQ